MLGSLNILLEGTRLLVGRVEPWIEPVSPARLVEEVVVCSGPAAERRGGMLRSRKTRATERWFALDRRRLHLLWSGICLSASGS
ncbi:MULTISPECIES: hypothetical protein [unclassified Thiocapsa]|uniref:hypothetical protein n=1 Tax=unclassified Thiocapsa TaxID=2641286 RepID=UPI0035B00734